MAIKSMTGFGRSQVQSDGIQLTVEILSVNRKHLDINIILPKHLNRFDPDIRKILGEFILRGHITLRVSAVFHQEAPLAVRANIAMAKQYYAGWQEIAEALSLDQTGFALSLLEKEPDLFIYQETAGMERFSELLKKGVQEALVPFIAMRQQEGSSLKADIIKRVQLLKSNADLIKDQSSDTVEKYRLKLMEKIQLMLPSLDMLDERLMKEIALFAEKVDISEELVRFHSHIVQMSELMEKGPPSAGKTAEFLVQELVREINTIGSKASDLAVTKKVVDIKTELERIREQIQNIE